MINVTSDDDHPLRKLNYDELVKFVAHLPITHDQVSFTDGASVRDPEPPHAILTVNRRNDPFIQDEVERLEKAVLKQGFTKAVLKWNKKLNTAFKKYELRFYLYV